MTDLRCEDLSTALKIFVCRVNGIKVEESFVSVTAGAARAKDFLAVSPLGKVPCLKARRIPLR